MTPHSPYCPVWPQNEESSVYFDVNTYSLRPVTELTFLRRLFLQWRLWGIQSWMDHWDYRFRMRYRDRWLRCKHGILESNCQICPEPKDRVQ